MREVDWRIRSIVDRNNHRNKFNAILHDKEIKTGRVSKDDRKKTGLTEAQENAMDKVIEEKMAREANGKQYDSN